MIFMNEYEIYDAASAYRSHPVLGPATQTLSNLAEWANANSDGWPYWPKPCRAAAKLQELIQTAERSSYRFEEPQVTVADYQAALRPVRAFRTRQGADFDIVEVDAP